jgi:hypothetical protein
LAAVYAAKSPMVRQRAELAAVEEGLRSEVQGLWRRNVVLERTRDALKGDPVMIEWVAKSRLGYTQPGVQALPPAKGSDGPSSAPPLERPTQASLLPEAWRGIVREGVRVAVALLGAGVVLTMFFFGDSAEAEAKAKFC